MPPAESATSATSKSSTSTIEQYVAKLSSDMVLACNSRHWDPEAYPWTQIAPDFNVGPTFATIPASMNLQEFLHEFSTLYAALPEYYTRSISMTAHLDTKAGEAQVYSNFENVNFTPGVIRHSIGMWVFKEVEKGKWLCVYYRSLPGPTG